jgi:tetratricopeptide (TPR) repeat protein
LEAHVHRAQGHVALRTGRLAEADHAYDEGALPIFRHFSLRDGEAHVLRGLGDLRMLADRFGEARQLYEQALRIYRTIGDRLGEANAQRSLADLSLLIDDHDGAERDYREAARIYHEIGVAEGERIVKEGLERIQR